MKAPSLQLLRAIRAVERSERSMSACPIQRGPSNVRNTIGPGLSGRIDRPALRAQLSSSTNACHSAPGKSSDRGPASNEDTQTDFGSLNVLGDTLPPTTSIDACLTDGFHLDNGLKIGGGSGCILLAGEAFSWRPWETAGKGGRSKMLNTKGQWAVKNESWGVLDLVWPKPGMEVCSFLA